MMEQMTLFDLEAGEIEEVDFDNTEEEAIVRIIGDAIGIDFKYKDSLFGWVARTKYLDMYVKYSNYSFGDCKRHISCNYNYKKNGQIGGCGMPSDSVNKAIDFFKEGLKQWS